MTIAKMNSVVDQLARSNIGYNQHTRWSFYQNGKIVPNTAADCSSICGAIAKMGGYNVNLTGTFYTGNMIDRFRAAGFTVLRFNSLSQVRKGDFIVNTVWHVEYAYSATRWYSARIDERGQISGGRPGNQTGKETGFVSAYIYSRGWNYILRPPTSSGGSAPAKKSNATLRFQQRANQYMQAGLVEDGDNGPVTKNWKKWVELAQRSLNAFKSGNTAKLVVDGDPGPVTANYVGVIQARNGLYKDRYLGPVMIRWMRSHGSKITSRPKNRP